MKILKQEKGEEIGKKINKTFEEMNQKLEKQIDEIERKMEKIQNLNLQ